MTTQDQINPIHPDVLPKLDPAFVELYNKHLAHIPPRAPDLSLIRKTYSIQYSYAKAPSSECAKEYDAEVDGWERYPGKIKIRIYVPQGTPPETGWPININFHGGGWALGDLDTESHICRHITTTANVLTIDVAYRLLPEYPFPTAIYDSLSLLKTVHTSPTFIQSHAINPASITLSGLSAGANIALILNHLARDLDPPIPIRAVTVGTPVLSDISKYASPSDSPFPSMTEMEYAPTLNWMRLKYFDNLKMSSLVIPATASPEALAQQTHDVSWFLDAFTALNYRDLAATTYIGTAGCDPLRDEGEAYGRLLEKHGNRVILRRFEGVPYPFQHMDMVLEGAREFIKDVCGVVRKAHYGGRVG